MTFPRLLDHEADEFESELLRSARADAASASPDPTLAAFGLTPRSAQAATAPASAPRPSFFGQTAVKWGAGVMGGAIVAATVAFVAQRPPAPVASPASAPPPVIAAPPAESPPTVSPAPVPPRPASVATPAKPRVRPQPVRERKRAAAPVPPPSVDVLSEEVRLLDQARWQISQKDGVAAIETVATYLARFPQGRLVLEAEVVRIQAVRMLSGDVAAARMAQAFLRRHPDSAHAPALRRLIESAATAPARP